MFVDMRFGYFIKIKGKLVVRMKQKLELSLVHSRGHKHGWNTVSTEGSCLDTSNSKYFFSFLKV